MLLKCTADGRRIKVNGAPVHQGNVGRGTGMKMTMSTTAMMSARVQRKVMRAPHKRAHPGKMASHQGKMAVHPGKMAAHAGKMAAHPGKMVHPGKLSHLGRFGKLQHYAHTAHVLRPPEPCGDSNDSGLGPEHDQRHAANRLSDPAEEWSVEAKRRRSGESGTDVKLECDDAIDAYTFLAAPAPAPAAPTAPPPDAHHDALTVHVPALIRASSSISSPGKVPESPGKRFPESPYRSCGKLGSAGKLATKYAGGGKLMGAGGKLMGAGGKLGGKLGGKYSGKLAQALARRRALAAMHAGPPGLAAPLTNRTRDAGVELQILCQPESQHRARYQTEGSRGAVKDNSGNGFPVVKLVGYDKPAVLQVFIGTDTGRVAPHMFYQACRVSGKNSTPCKERKEDGTVIIEIDLEPAKNWQVTCDCVGILKERNVDVEHRFGESLGVGGVAGAPGGAGTVPGVVGGAATAAHMSRGKKKSTRCRMVFRTEVMAPDGHTETLQVCSTQIICTQPPGVPEVCRKSLVSCPATGGLELYLLGKNFLKESKVVFCQRQDGRTIWEEEVAPDKEFLQQTHLVCCVPPYRTDVSSTVTVQLFVRSGGKTSEPHPFYYTPPALQVGPLHCTTHHTQGGEAALWGGLMPPPAPPAGVDARRVSHEALGLKAELCDDGSQHSLESPPGVDARGEEDAAVVDLRLKTETAAVADTQTLCYAPFADGIKLSGSPPTGEAPSPLVSFTQQLQAIQNQVQTDKMVETVTAALFNAEDGSGQMYVEQQMMQTMPMRLMASEPATAYDPFGAIGKMESRMERRLARQSAQIDALVEDAMKATAAMLPADAAKLDALVNSRADDHLSVSAAPPSASAVSAPAPSDVSPDAILDPAVPPAMLCDEMMSDPCQIASSVKTPPAAVKSMILNAAAEILTSDSAMNALVTSAINTANILTTDAAAAETPPAEPAQEAPLAAAVSAAVTQAVSQAVSHAVSQAVTQEMAAPVQRLTDMSDSDLLSYINPSAFDQV